MQSHLQMGITGVKLYYRTLIRNPLELLKKIPFNFVPTCSMSQLSQHHPQLKAPESHQCPCTEEDSRSATRPQWISEHSSLFFLLICTKWAGQTPLV